MKKSIFFIIVFAVYFLMSAGIMWIFIKNFDDGLLGYHVRSTAEKLLDLLKVIAPFIILILGQVAVFFVGRKQFETWGISDMLISIALSATAFFSCAKLMVFLIQ